MCNGEAGPWTIIACELLEVGEAERLTRLTNMGARERAALEGEMKRISWFAELVGQQFRAIHVRDRDTKWTK